MYIYGDVEKNLVKGWNVILAPIPLTFTLGGVIDMDFVVINNTASDESTHFLQARIERATGNLLVWSWSNMNNVQIMFDNQISVRASS